MVIITPVAAYYTMQVFIQSFNCALGSVTSEVCLALLNTTGSQNRTTDTLILCTAHIL